MDINAWFIYFIECSYENLLVLMFVDVVLELLQFYRLVKIDLGLLE